MHQRVSAVHSQSDILGTNDAPCQATLMSEGGCSGYFRSGKPESNMWVISARLWTTSTMASWTSGRLSFRNVFLYPGIHGPTEVTQDTIINTAVPVEVREYSLGGR